MQLVSHAECGVTRKPIKSNSSAGCGVRYKFENFENILFAKVNFEVFDAELRKQKQPDSDDDDANEWRNKSISNVFFVLKNGGILKNGRDL